MYHNWGGKYKSNPTPAKRFKRWENQDPSQMEPQRGMHYQPVRDNFGGVNRGMLGRETLEKLRMEQQKVNQYWMEIQGLNQQQMEHEIMRRQLDEQKKKVEEDMFAAIRRGKLLEMSYQQIHGSPPNIRQNRFPTLPSNIGPVPQSSQQINMVQSGFSMALSLDISKTSKGSALGQAPSKPYPSTSYEQPKANTESKKEMCITKSLKRKKIPEDEEECSLDSNVTKFLHAKCAPAFMTEMMSDWKSESYFIEDSGSPVCVVQITHDGLTLGEGKGETKALASERAAENTIKNVYCRYFFKDIDTRPYVFSKKRRNCLEMGSPISVFPWVEFAALCVHKLFAKWEEKGLKLKFGKSKIRKKFLKKRPPVELKALRKLPPNANQIDPVVLLSKVKPENCCSVTETISEGNVRTWKVEYDIEGRRFFGEGPTPTKAKEEAAKRVLGALYGIRYPSYTR